MKGLPMNNDEISIRELLKRYDAGEYEDKQNITKMCEAGWHDWFCKDIQLGSRLKPLVGFLKKIKNFPLIDIDNDYVYFKNNCPMHGPLYDSFGVCEMSDSKKQKVWVGFLRSGVYDVPYFRVEVCFNDEFLPFIKNGSLPESGDGTYGDPFEFLTRADALEFFKNKERISEFFKMKEEGEEKKFNIHQVPALSTSF